MWNGSCQTPTRRLLSPLVSTERNIEEGEILKRTRIVVGDKRDGVGCERHRQCTGPPRSWRRAESGKPGRARTAPAATPTGTTEPPAGPPAGEPGVAAATA